MFLKMADLKKIIKKINNNTMLMKIHVNRTESSGICFTVNMKKSGVAKKHVRVVKYTYESSMTAIKCKTGITDGFFGGNGSASKVHSHFLRPFLLFVCHVEG